MDIDTIFPILVVLFLSLVMILKYFLHDYFNAKTPNKNVTKQPQDKQEQFYQEKLTIQEKIALSWRFLKEITAKVLNFSSLDKERIRICGDILKNNGMQYQHVVDNNINKYIENKQIKTGKEVSGKRI